MKRLYIWLVITHLVPSAGSSQKLDSVNYSYGYLYYHEYGSREPVIILSGGPGGSYLQQETVAAEVGKKYRSILLEQRGTGRSMPTPLDSTTINLRSAIADLHLLLQHLKLQKAIFLGHSWGSMLAMSYAASYPSNVKSLILVGPGPYKEWTKNAQIFETSWKSRMGKEQQLIFDSVNKKIASAMAIATDSQARRKLILETYNFDKSLSDTIQKRTKSVPNLKMRDLMLADLKKNYDLSSTLKQYKGPINVICGRQDYVVYNAYELKLLMPSVQLHWIEQCGHWPQFEQPKAFYDTLLNLLK